jgi:ABC-type transport system involved in multi-copper enzyme maturation permease subunit
MNPFSLNPIIALEWRARWRGVRAFRLLLLCVVLLSVVAFFSYYSAVETFNYNQNRSSIESASRAGSGLFIGLSLAQILGWMLIAPLMTATTIAAEREQGILEGVQLSRLKPLQIVLGKLASALIFALLLGATTLPIVGICFLLGGVSPGEFAQSWALQFSTALCGASAGLFFSAHSRRAGAALRGALISLVAWFIGSYIIFAMGLGGMWTNGRNSGNSVFAQLMVLQGYANPVLVAGDSIVGRVNGGGGFLSSSTAATGKNNAISQLISTIMAQPPWLVCMALQGLATLLFLLLAARALRRPFGASDESAARRKQEGRAKTARPRGTAPKADAVAASASASTRASSESGDWWEVPYFSKLTFQNPMLQREVRGKFRMRRVSLVAIVFEGLLALGVLYLYVRALGWALTNADARTTIWWVLSWVGLILILVAMPVMGAAAFTRERESGTFEGVMLSLLSNRDIERGKLLAPLFACAVYGVLPLLPLLLLCLRPQAYTSGAATNWRLGITIWQAIATFCVLGAAAYAGTSIGMAASWTARRTSESVGRSLGIMFFWLAILPALVASTASIFFSDSVSDSMLDTGSKLVAVSGNPALALTFLSGNEKLLFDSNAPLGVAFLSVCGSIFVAACARFYLRRAMHMRALEHERKH